MSVYKEYHHLIPSLEVYPRVHFFSKRYHDIVEKYKKFKDKSSEKLSVIHIEAPKNCLENGLTIKVIGKEDLDPTVFIATDSRLYETKPSSRPEKGERIKFDTIFPLNPHKDCISSTKKVHEAKEFSTLGKDSTTTVVIYNADVERLNDKAVEDIKLLRNKFGTKKELESDGNFLLCQSRNNFTSSDESVFRKKLDCWKLAHISTRERKDLKIGDEISLYLEDKLVQSLLTVQSSLQTYTTGKKRCSTPKPILEEEIIQFAVKQYIHHIPQYGRELSDSVKHEYPLKLKSAQKQMTKLTLEEKKTYKVHLKVVNSKTVKLLMVKLALLLKCSIVQALAKRHNITVTQCNHILIQKDFEQMCTKIFSKPLQYRVKKLWYCSEECCDEEMLIYKKVTFESVMPLLQKDLFSFVTELEKGISQFATTSRKLLFEISSCLKKTKVNIEKIRGHIIPPKTKVDFDLRREILSLKEVCGIGTIYGQLEIHVNEIDAIKKIESQVRDMLRRRNVSCLFSVRVLNVKLEMLANRTFHEHGERIECENRFGTLAGFLEGSDQRLYGLTCAHVVKAEEECDVFIYDGLDRRLEFAKCVPHLVVSTGSSASPLIDIAAVRVHDHVENKCFKFLKNDESMLHPGVIAADTTDDLAGNPVYKHGATSQLTKGLVSSDDYSTISTQDRHYIFLIENYDDDGEEVFAEPGDSGSMICTPDENEVYIVKAVGILNGRTITPTEEDAQKFFSFRLIDGLRKLASISGGIQFNFPKSC